MSQQPSPQNFAQRRLAFIGLGVMGFPMAGHLARAGHEVTVYNRSPARAEQWLSLYAANACVKAVRSPAEAAQQAELVMLCVGRDEDVREVVTARAGVAETIRPDAVVIDHSTTSAALAREMANYLQQRQAYFIDAPVSGGEQGAVNGQLTILCGGEADAFAKAEPVLRAYARAVTHLGASGSGQLAKMVNQICIAGLLQGLAEGVNFGLRAGLDMPKVMAALGQGAAQSWQMQNRAHTMLEDSYNFGFAVDWMRKDLGYCLAAAEEIGADLPVTQLVNEYYNRLQAMGGGRWDTSSLLKVLQQSASVRDKS
ncbi:MAG TPA: NAD(P)-dependent oxidoreductase [Methylophilaceae bacterium]|nr:NAD(P)-dependent oxidoreductase [Methylophilaceae bacterium]